MFMSKTSAPPPYEDYSDHFSPLEVTVGSYFEDGFRKFKSAVQKSKILSDYKDRRYYEKPSERKRRKRRDAQERLRLLDLKEKMMATGEWDKRQKAKEDQKRARIERHRRAADSSE